MKIGKIIVIAVLIFLLYSCSDHKRQLNISFVKINEFEVGNNRKLLFPINSRIVDVDSSIRLYFQDFETQKTIMFVLSEKKMQLTLKSKTDENNFFTNLFYLSSDSIYFFKNNTNKLVLKDSLGKVLQEYPVSETFTPAIHPTIQLTGNDKNFLIGNASRTIGFGEKEDRLKYYRDISPILLMSIRDSLLLCQAIGKFPEEYVNTGNSYNDPFASACFGHNNNICISFGADNNLYLYKDSNLVLSKKVLSKFIDEFNAYPDEKRFDMLYMKNYIQEEPKYLSIVYDPWGKLYYRLVKHRFVRESNKNITEKFWSVIVLDQELNTIGETKFSFKFDPKVFIPTPFGVLLKHNSNSANNTIFTLMKLKKND